MIQPPLLQLHEDAVVRGSAGVDGEFVGTGRNLERSTWLGVELERLVEMRVLITIGWIDAELIALDVDEDVGVLVQVRIGRLTWCQTLLPDRHLVVLIQKTGGDGAEFRRFSGVVTHGLTLASDARLNIDAGDVDRAKLTA